MDNRTHIIVSLGRGMYMVREATTGRIVAIVKSYRAACWYARSL